MNEPTDEARKAALRTSERLKAVASQALSRDAVATALATKLVAGGLGLLAFSAGVDYFGAGMQQTVEKLATGAGATGVAETVHQVEGWLGAAKAWILAQLPDTPREVALSMSSLGGVVVLGWGLALKMRAPDRGRSLRDVGNVLLGPGLLGALLFVVRSWQERAQLRVPLRGFWEKLTSGAMKGSDLWAFTVQYAPWTWDAIAPLLVLGIALLGVAFALRSRGTLTDVRVGRAVACRTAAWGGLLAVSFYALVTVIGVMTYAAGIPCFTWAWKERPWVSLATLGFMSLGAGLVGTGKVMMRETAALGPSEGPDPGLPLRKAAA